MEQLITVEDGGGGGQEVREKRNRRTTIARPSAKPLNLLHFPTEEASNGLSLAEDVGSSAFSSELLLDGKSSALSGDSWGEAH